MKKILLTIFAVGLLTACGTKTTNVESTDIDSTTIETIVVDSIAVDSIQVINTDTVQ